MHVRGTLHATLEEKNPNPALCSAAWRSPKSTKCRILIHLFHVLKDHQCGNRSWSLLNDLLVPALHRTVTAKEGNGIAILICKDLHLQVARLFGKTHHKDGGSWNFRLHLRTKTNPQVRQVPREVCSRMWHLLPLSPTSHFGTCPKFIEAKKQQKWPCLSWFVTDIAMHGKRRSLNTTQVCLTLDTWSQFSMWQHKLENYITLIWKRRATLKHAKNCHFWAPSRFLDVAKEEMAAVLPEWCGKGV